MSSPSTDLAEVAKAICTKRGFSFGRPIGGGSFKQAFHVTHAGTPLALKLIMGGSVDRLVREINAVSRCNHPNIGRLSEVQIEASANGQIIYFVEPFLAGGTLGARVRNRGLLKPDEVHLFARQLVSALIHIASLDLVHRDIKPENIMFGDDLSRPTLVDFGLVRDLAAESLTQSHMARGPGTPFFAPPEQLNNQKELIDWRADQFALGATLSMCALGFHPYAEPSDSESDVVEKVARRSTLSPRFIDAAKLAGIEPLIRLVQPYPVLRHCFPDSLLKDWG